MEEAARAGNMAAAIVDRTAACLGIRFAGVVIAVPIGSLKV